MSEFTKRLKTTVRETDFLLLFLCLSASVYGIISVHSATLRRISESDIMSRDVRTMILAVFLGAAAAVAVSFIDYSFIEKMLPAVVGICLLLMLALFFVGVGREERPDAKIWIALGSTGLYFQPSELVKIGFIITLSVHIELVHDKLANIFQLMFLCLHAFVPIGLVIISGDLGSALVFMVIFMVMIFCAGVQLRFFAMGAAGICAAVPAVWYFLLSSTQKERFLGLLYPDRYALDIMYQQDRGLEAIASGGLTGQGLFNGKYTQSGTVPEEENDMIFTVFAEELGLVGCILALIILLAVVIRIIHTGCKSKNAAGYLMCCGTAAMIASQVVINIGMCLKILPVIGITLPFFSAGGSSNLCLYIGIGLVMSIYRFNREREITSFRLRNITAFDN